MQRRHVAFAGQCCPIARVEVLCGIGLCDLYSRGTRACTAYRPALLHCACALLSEPPPFADELTWWRAGGRSPHCRLILRKYACSCRPKATASLSTSAEGCDCLATHCAILVPLLSCSRRSVQGPAGHCQDSCGGGGPSRAVERLGSRWGQHCREPRSTCALEPRLADSRPRAGLHRQFLFGGLRIGLYEPVKRLYVGEKAAGEAPLYLKIAAGLTTGALAIMVANPTDLVKVPPRACGHCPVVGRCAFFLEARLEGRGTKQALFFEGCSGGALLVLARSEVWGATVERAALCGGPRRCACRRPPRPYRHRRSPRPPAHLPAARGRRPRRRASGATRMRARRTASFCGARPGAAAPDHARLPGRWQPAALPLAAESVEPQSGHRGCSADVLPAVRRPC